MSTDKHIAINDITRMFDLGLDTATIAQVLNVHESNVYNFLAFAKDTERYFGSDAQVIRTSTKREQHLEERGGSNLSLFDVSELEDLSSKRNNETNERPKAD